MINYYTGKTIARNWTEKYRECLPRFACVLGFTETGLIEGISAAGATPEDRKYTALADAEFLVNGVDKNPAYPLPPLTAGASPVYISRAVVEGLNIAVDLFNAGLMLSPSVPCIDLEGSPARCLSTGNALDINVVDRLFQNGLKWGKKLAGMLEGSYLIIGECVVGGTTTANAILTGSGFEVMGKINSSHPTCNHAQKQALVDRGLGGKVFSCPFRLVAAVGDPMQIAVAGMAIGASESIGVLLAGGTQMIAVHALIRSICREYNYPFHPENTLVGTTRWVMEDTTGNTIELAKITGDVPLIATDLNFVDSKYPALRAYENGFVKEGVGAGGCAIAASLYANLANTELVGTIENLLKKAG